MVVLFKIDEQTYWDLRYLLKVSYTLNPNVLLTFKKSLLVDKIYILSMGKTKIWEGGLIVWNNWLNEHEEKEERSVATLLIIETFLDDMRKVVFKWTGKIMVKDILELDEARLKMDFMILRSKLEFMNRLNFLSDYDLLVTSIDALEKDVLKQFEKAVNNIVVDKFIEALKSPFCKWGEPYGNNS